MLVTAVQAGRRRLTTGITVDTEVKFTGYAGLAPQEFYVMTAEHGETWLAYLYAGSLTFNSRMEGGIPTPDLPANPVVDYHGLLLDGYLSGCKLWIDANANGKVDSTDVTVATFQGHFNLTIPPLSGTAIYLLPPGKASSQVHVKHWTSNVKPRMRSLGRMKHVLTLEHYLMKNCR